MGVHTTTTSITWNLTLGNVGSFVVASGGPYSISQINSPGNSYALTYTGLTASLTPSSSYTPIITLTNIDGFGGYNVTLSSLSQTVSPVPTVTATNTNRGTTSISWTLSFTGTSSFTVANGPYDITSQLDVSNNAYTLSLNVDVPGGNDIKYIIKETVYQSSDATQENATAVAVVQSFIPKSNTLTVTTISGEFVDGYIIYGASSNAQYRLTTFDPLMDNSYSDSYDNKVIDTEANSIVNFSESNPFGEI
mgnify:CR=1 FL=1